MEKEKELELFGGEVIMKCYMEHFTPQQAFYGDPYYYLIEYSKYGGGSPERRYGLWKFDDKALTYSLFQTAGEKDYKTLVAIARQWEKEISEERHIKKLENLPRRHWSDEDLAKYPHIKTYEDIEAENPSTPLSKNRKNKR